MAESVWDAIVIGAGPAGSTMAIQLARQGKRVLLVDKATFPRTKVCGCCLSGKAVTHLKKLGLDSVLANAIPLDEFCLASGNHSAVVRTNGGFAISRLQLDQKLIHKAISKGVEFCDGISARLGETQSDSRVVILLDNGQQIETRARMILCCAGLGNASLGRSIPIEETVDASPRVGVTTLIPEYESLKDGQIQMSVSSDGYVGITRLESKQVVISAAIHKKAIRNGGSLSGVVQKIIETSGKPVPKFIESAKWLGTRELTREVTVPADQRVLILGDAAGYIEPFTGEGIGWAVEASQLALPLAIEGIRQWDSRLIDRWTSICRQQFKKRKRTCRILKKIVVYPTVVGTVIRLLRLFPVLATPVLRSIHGNPNLFPKKSL